MLLGLLAALAVTAPAQAGSGLLVGVDDDDLKWTTHPQPSIAALRDLGVRAIRMTAPWQPGENRLSAADRKPLDRGIVAAYGMRVVLALYGRASDAPQTAAAQAQFCSYAADLLHTYPTVNDLVIWNEPNSPRFWVPQFDGAGTAVAPQAYEGLLARCWDMLHALRPSVNLIAASAPHGNDRTSISPGNWYPDLGAVYRATGRRLPIFDTVGHNAYPERTSERPWVHHPGTSIDEGDYDKLMAALSEGFSGTAQPLPGEGRVTIWYMEQGFQSTIDPTKLGLYGGQENDRFALPPWSARSVTSAQAPAPDQATQLFNAIQLAYCQPAVGAFFNFELADEPVLSGWQSGVLWTDFTPKPSYYGFKQAIASAASGKVDCGFYAQAGAPSTSTAPVTTEPVVTFTVPGHKTP